MTISCKKLAKTPYVFRQLTGLTVAEFGQLVEKVRSEWENWRNRRNAMEESRMCRCWSTRFYVR